MESSARALASLVAAVGLAAAACIATDGFCPCGADPDEGVDAHDLSFAGEHFVNDQCVCRCGDDPVFGAKQDDDGACPDDGRACDDELGLQRTLACY